MKKVIKTGWLVIAFASLIVGFWLIITEPLAHSGFYIYFITAFIALLLNFGPDLWKQLRNAEPAAKKESRDNRKR